MIGLNYCRIWSLGTTVHHRAWPLRAAEGFNAIASIRHYPETVDQGHEDIRVDRFRRH